MEVSLGSRASRPLGQLWACGPLAGGTPALPGTAAPVLSLPSRRTGKASGRGDGPWRLRQGSSRTPGARASHPLEHLWACGPLAGGTPALPGTAAPVLSLPSRRTGKASGRGDGPWRLRQGSSRTPGARASRPLEHLWACGPLAGGTPAIPGTAAPVLSLPSRRTGKASGRGDGPWRLRQDSSRTPGARASHPLEHLWACGPLAGGTPALPGTPLRCFHFLRGVRAKRAGEATDPGGSARTRVGPRERGRLTRLNICGPAAHLRARRPRSQELRLRCFHFLRGVRAKRAGEATDPGGSARDRVGPRERGRLARLDICGPAAHLRAGRPRSQELRLRCFHFLRGVRAKRAGEATDPGDSARARVGPWERGRLARLDICGPAAHLRAGRPRSQELRLRPRVTEPGRNPGSAGRIGRRRNPV